VGSKQYIKSKLALSQDQDPLDYTKKYSTFAMFKNSAILFIAASLAQAALNGPCTMGSTPGVCLDTGDCTSGGGTYASGYCPNDPTNVKCCYKTSCGTSGGNCRFTSSCASGNTQSGLCPGPSSFKCCLPSSGGSCTAPNVNAATLSLIKQSESFVASPAPDPKGHPTVGYGHLCQTTGCSEVPYSFPLTPAQAFALLASDLKTYQNCLYKALASSVKLNDNQYGALVSWTFNEGCGNMQTSTLIKRLNNGEAPNTVASEELPKWIYAGKSVLPGLPKRRAAEVTLFETASSVTAHPAC